MPKKKSKKSKKNKKNQKDILDEEIIIGIDTKNKKEKPPKKQKKKLVKKKKTKKQKKKRKNKIKKILKVLLRLAIVVAIAAGVIVILFVSPIFNIQEINVIGAVQISESVYVAMSGLEIGNNIFEVDKTGIISEIKKEAYVETVEIKSMYPNKIEIDVVERTVSYIAEAGGRYYYIDKNGYLLETNLANLDFPIIKGYTTELENTEVGSRLNDKDLSRFNDLIKIIDAVKNNEITAKLASIDISDNNNYILEFPDEKKKVMLGEAADLSAKMAWINLFFREKKEDEGIIHLNGNEIYFSSNT